MKKLSILALAATALLISGANGIAANNNTLQDRVVSRKEVAGEVHQVTVGNVYSNPGGWLATNGSISVGFAGLDGSAFGSVSLITIDEACPKVAIYDPLGNSVPIALIELHGNGLAIDRTQEKDRTNNILHIPAGFKFTVGNSQVGDNSQQYLNETFEVSEDAYFLGANLDGTGAGAWTEIQMPSSISVDSETLEIETGKSHQIVATKEGGSENVPFRYTTSDASIATVDSTGKINALGEGEATITVNYGFMKKNITVTVTGEKATQTGIKITKGKEIMVSEGTSYKLSSLEVKALYGDIEGEVITLTEDMISGEYDKDTIGVYTLTVTVGTFTDTFTVSVVAIPETTIPNLTPGNGFGNNSLWGTQFYFVVGLPDVAQYLNISGEELAAVNEKFLINGEGNQIKNMKNLGGGRYEFWLNKTTFKMGDVITVQKGMPIYRYSGTTNGATHDPNGDGEYYVEAKLDKEYKFVYDGVSWLVYQGASTELKVEQTDILLSVDEAVQINFEVGPEGTYDMPIFTSQDETIVSVSDTGNIIGLKVGTTTVTVTLGDIVKTINVNVAEPKEIKEIKIVEIPNYYSLLKDSDPSEFKPTLTKAKLIFVDDTESAVFNINEEDYTIGSFTTAEEGDINVPLKVKYKGTEYNSSLKVNVYTYFDQEVKEVAIVDWFSYAVFIQCDNTCSNAANITGGDEIANTREKIKYTRKDGTEVPLRGNYQLGYRIAIFPEFIYAEDGSQAINENNYNSKGFYEVGDTITIEQDCPIYKWTGNKGVGDQADAMVPGTGEIICEGYFKQTLQFKYNGTIWTTWIEYNDINLSQTSMDLQFGKTAKVPVDREPANATQGTFSYVSSDTSVVTVTDNGIMKGVKPGTATITITLSDPDYPEKTKTATLKVTVTDSIVGFKVKEDVSLKIKKGTTAENLVASLKAEYLYASGKVEGEVNFEGATVSNYDPSTTGEQDIVVSIKVNGNVVKQKLTIEVVSAGCGGSIIASSAIISTLAVAGVAVGIASKKKKRK